MNGTHRRTPYTEFTKEMKKTHTVLIPSMLDFHFPLLVYAFRAGGYKAQVLSHFSGEVIAAGWEYSNNDICYPANLIIGQFVTALKSGRYDTHKTALLLPQSGGGCRACNYIHLLRKALVKAGMGYVPVISLNVSGVEKHSGFSVNLKMLLTACAAVMYSDLLMHLYNCTSPYEKSSGECKKLLCVWRKRLSKAFESGRLILPDSMGKVFDRICSDFSKVKTLHKKYPKICVTGELYVKFCSIGNDGLEDFLRGESCEVYMSGFANYMMYLMDNCKADDSLYDRTTVSGALSPLAVKIVGSMQERMNKALAKYSLPQMSTYKYLKEKCSWAGSFGQTMGDGWLISAEAADGLQNGCDGCIIAVPFGCLVSHTAARGVISRLRKRFPNAAVSAVDHDSGLSRINRRNRIKMIISFAQKNVFPNRSE